MGQCQQCQQTLLSDTVYCKRKSCADSSVAADPEVSEEENDDVVVQNDAGGYTGNTDTGLLAVWKWDAKPHEKQSNSNGARKGEIEPPWPARKDATGTLVLARHLLFNPHLRYKYDRCYKSERKIGAGTYGDVYEATALSSVHGETPADQSQQDETSVRRVAVKAFNMEVPATDAQENPGNSEGSPDKQKLAEIARRRASFEAERSVLAQIEHPHIVKMHECFEEKNCLYIVLELCRGGELYERIAQKVVAQGGKGFDEKLARHLFRQMLYAVSYLHANRIVHRDIKTENFLLLGQIGSDDADVLKLCDFGTAIRLSAQRPRSNGRVGTLSYMAPEVYANRGADICADVWSLGVVLYLILVGANPFRNSSTKTKVATVRKIESGDFDQTRLGWLDLSEEARLLIKSLLVLEEEKRLTCVESLRHQWVKRQDGIREGTSATEASESEKPRPAALATPRVGLEQDPGAHAGSVLMLLMRYAAMDPMQKVVLAACSQTISEKQLSDMPTSIPWHALFLTLDENGDGRIGFDEFTKGMKALLGDQKVSTEKLLTLARALDTDGSGAIEWGEWLSVGLLTVEQLAESSEPLTSAFRLLDRPTGDGKVGAADLLAVVDGGTGGGEYRVPADVVREQILSAITQYIPKREAPVSAVASIAPPSLVENDVRNILQTLSAR